MSRNGLNVNCQLDRKQVGATEVQFARQRGLKVRGSRVQHPQCHFTSRNGAGAELELGLCKGRMRD